MITTSKWLGLLAIAFVSGSFLASPELRAFAANTVFSTDIVDGEVKAPDIATNAVTAAEIKDNEVKAAEIAADAVGASELAGVTKLLFGQCLPTASQQTTSRAPATSFSVSCNITGVDSDDSASATLNKSQGCFKVSSTFPSTDQVSVWIRNDCTVSAALGSTSSIAVIVYDK